MEVPQDVEGQAVPAVRNDASHDMIQVKEKRSLAKAGCEKVGEQLSVGSKGILDTFFHIY